jgi:hypothetical protein
MQVRADGQVGPRLLLLGHSATRISDVVCLRDWTLFVLNVYLEFSSTLLITVSYSRPKVLFKLFAGGSTPMLWSVSGMNVFRETSAMRSGVSLGCRVWQMWLLVAGVSLQRYSATDATATGVLAQALRFEASVGRRLRGRGCDRLGVAFESLSRASPGGRFTGQPLSPYRFQP